MGRLVKRYGNRKLYDTSESRYVTLEEIGRWVKAGEEVKILENDTGEDLTAVTFAQIILEEERRKTGLLSLPVLRDIIQHGEAAGRIRGDEEGVLYTLGTIYLTAGKLKEAELTFQHICDVVPGASSCPYGVALVASQRRQRRAHRVDDGEPR